MLRAMLQILLLAALLPVFGECSQWKSSLQRATAPINNNTPAVVQYAPKSNITTLEPQFFREYNSSRVQVRYGPFSVEPVTQTNGMIDELQVGATMPCANCTITYIEAGLEYPNGSYANANTSMWLHHILLINLAHGDTVCGKNYYGKGQRWFASGNERVPADIARNGTMKVGYYIGTGDINIMLVELMNQATVNQTAVATITYEYIPGMPTDFYSATPLWLDIAGCDIASDMPAKSNTSFSYTAPNYVANFTGAVTDAIGHLHDGGTHLEVTTNGSVTCDSVARYGQTSGYIDPNTSSMSGMSGMSDMKHISSMSSCHAPTLQVELEDVLSTNAYFDFTEYAPMTNTDGSLSDIMGIALIYVATNMTQAQMASMIGSMTYNDPSATTDVPSAATSAPYMAGMDSGGSGPSQCTAADSPGNLTTDGLDMSNDTVAMNFLAAILDDTCLQVWSLSYANAFWYGIVVVIGLFAATNILRRAQLLLRKRAASAGKAITNGASLTTGLAIIFRSISYPQMRPAMRFFKAMPTGTNILILAYFAFIIILSFVRTSTGDDQTFQSIGIRATWLSMAQLPLVVLLANKRNFVGFVTAVGYERLNVLHRWSSRGLLLTATFHFGFQNTGWIRLGLMKMEWTTDSCPPTGLAAYVLLLWMNLSTLAPFRHLSYEFFVVQHIVTFIGFIAAVLVHIPTTALHARIYVYISIALYFAARLIQGAIYAYRNIRRCRGMVTRVSSDVVRVCIRNPTIKTWTPGAHILLGMPRYGLFQSHPATIASTPESHNGELVFFLRGHKGFTGRLRRGAAEGGDHLTLIDGPYRSSHSDFAAFGTTVLIAGSTGISFTLPILLDIASRASKTILPVQNIHFIWAIRESADLSWVETELRTALDALRAADINVSMHVHVTGLVQGASLFAEDRITRSSYRYSKGVYIPDEKKEPVEVRAQQLRTNSQGSSPSSDSPPSTSSQSLETEKLAVDKLVMIQRRPNLPALLEDIRGRYDGEIGVGVCGPLSMALDVRNKAAKLQWVGKGGVYMHAEGFSW